MELQKRIEDEIENQRRGKNVSADMLQSGSKRLPFPEIRRSITLKLVNEYGISMAETARRLGISTSAVAQILRREKRIRIALANRPVLKQHWLYAGILYGYQLQILSW
jgi:predicted HTH domain antitoxin